MFFHHENASKHYCRRTNYRVQTLKATALVDTAMQAVLNVHCTTGKPHDTQFGWQVACRDAGDLHSLDKGYDWMQLREKPREEGVKPLIKHRIFRPIDYAHNARIDGLATVSDRCVRPPSRRSSARTASMCVCKPGIENFENSS